MEKVSHSPPEQWRIAKDRIASVLESHGWTVTYPTEQTGIDLVIEKGGWRYVIELKVARDPRRHILQALLADAILHSRRWSQELDALPLAIVGAPHISEAMARQLREYVDAVAPGQAFGLVDQRGLCRFIGKGFGDIPEPRDPVSGVAGDPGQPRNLFSDLNQWLLKVLLGRRLPAEYIEVPRGPLSSLSQLAKAARVSLPSAWRLIQQLSEEGFLDGRAADYEVVRVPELLRRWKSAASLSPSRQFPAAWALRSGERNEPLMRALRRMPDGGQGRPRDMCVGLFSACEAMRLGFVRGVPSHLYVREYDSLLLQKLDLVPAGPGEQVDVNVRVPRWKESVFRARVSRDGVWVADVLQCWLDVSSQAARGEEQADFLWRRVLSPNLELGNRHP